MSLQHPFLYEAYGPAKVKDAEKILTITLLAVGKATIVDAYAKDAAGVKITSAKAGDKITFYISVRNDGGADYIWIRVSDKDTGTLMWDIGPYSQGAGTYLNVDTAQYTMPSRTLNVLIEAGHGT